MLFHPSLCFPSRDCENLQKLSCLATWCQAPAMPKHSDLLECFKYIQILNISLLEGRLWTSSGHKASQLLRKSRNHDQNLLKLVFLLGGLADYAWRAVFRVPCVGLKKPSSMHFTLLLLWTSVRQRRGKWSLTHLPVMQIKCAPGNKNHSWHLCPLCHWFEL